MFEKNKNAFEDLTFEGETDTQAIEESKELIEDETDFHYDRALYAGDDIDEDVDFDDEWHDKTFIKILRVVVLECKTDTSSSLSHLYILAGHIDNTLQ